MEPVLVRAQFEHVRQHGHMAAIAGAQVCQRGAHRRRIGVVAVLDERATARQGVLDTAHRRSLQVHHGTRCGWGSQRDGHGRGGGHVAALPNLHVSQIQRNGRFVAEPHHPAVIGQRINMGSEGRVVVGHHRNTTGCECLEDFRLGGRDRLDRAQQLQMHGTDTGDDGHVRRRERREFRDLPGATHAHLDDRNLGVLGQPQDAERHAHLGVAIARRTLGAHADRA